MTVDKTVRRETLFVAAWVGIFSLFMQAVFLVIGRWDYTVLLGNLLGAAAAVGNFFLMGLTVQSAVQKEEKDAKQAVSWYKKAAEQGVPEAQFNLALCYYDSIGTHPDTAAARQWLRKTLAAAGDNNDLRQAAQEALDNI